MSFNLEVCVDNIESAINAINAGATSLEVCSSLKDDGLTPSNGLVMVINNYLMKNNLKNKVKIYAMIRPRGGDFCYSSKEIDQMLFEIQQLKEMVTGLVFGVLLPNGELDLKSCKKLIDECSEYCNTFHRAIDVCKNIEFLIEDIIKLGFKRILTSGQNESAIEGVNNIKKIINICNSRIEVVPASKINSDNIKSLICELNVKTYHLSGKELKKSKLETKNIKNYDYDYYVTSEKIVSKIIKEANSLI